MTQYNSANHRITRRSIVGAGLGTVGATAALSHARLANASQAAGQTGSPAATADMIPGGDPGVPDIYLRYPEPLKTVSSAPGNGGSVKIFKATQLPPPPPKDQNAYWQELDKRLGVTTDFLITPLDSYGERVATLFASGELPDIMLLWFSLAPTIYDYIDQGAFTDLTQFLDGDALLEYPNLSKYPDWAWRNARIGDKIFMVPRMNFLFGTNTLVYRRDWAEKLGNPEPTTADEVFDLLVAMTDGDPDGNGQQDTWGFSSAWGMNFIGGMFRVPNNWRRNDDGTLTKDFESEEYREAIAFARRLYEAGVYHPDAATMTNTERADRIKAGQVGSQVGSVITLVGAQRLRMGSIEFNPEADMRVLLPPGFDGGAGVTYTSNGNLYANAIPISAGENEDRVRELLRILDYYGALFGSEEYTFLSYGLPERHHTLQEDGSPILTDTGKAEVNELGNVGFPPRVFYHPDVPDDYVIYLQDTVKGILAIGIDDPTANLYSVTQVDKAVELDQLNQDRETAIITGRESLDALDSWINDWRSRGGDQIRQEFEQGLQGQ